jgi:hypothetical protein
MPLRNDRPLELGECASYLVEQASCRRRGVDVLLIQVGIDPTGYNRPSAPLIFGNTGDSGTTNSDHDRRQAYLKSPYMFPVSSSLLDQNLHVGKY